MEPAVAWIVERFSKTRAQAAVAIGLLIWAVGFGTVLSFNVLADFTFWRGTIFDNLGCQRVDTQVWCDVQKLGGGPRGYLPAGILKPAVSPDGSVAEGPQDSALRAGRGDFDGALAIAEEVRRRRPYDAAGRVVPPIKVLRVYDGEVVIEAIYAIAHFPDVEPAPSFLATIRENRRIEETLIGWLDRPAGLTGYGLGVLPKTVA